MRERNVDVPYSEPEIKEHHLRDGSGAPYGITYSSVTVYLRERDTAVDRSVCLESLMVCDQRRLMQ